MIELCAEKPCVQLFRRVCKAEHRRKEERHRGQHRQHDADAAERKAHAAKDQEGWEVKLSTEESTDIREEVFFKMAEHHYPILEMQSKKVSLEEIFLELTEDDKKKKPEEPEKEGETK